MVIKGQLSGNRDSPPHIMSILQGRTHALEALAIVLCVGWIPANDFPCLMHLYISFGISAKPPEPEGILTLLCNTPFVEIVHFHHLTAPEDEALDEPSKPLRVELPRLRSSVVFTVSAYHPVVEILNSLSPPPSALIRLDNLFVPYNREAPPSIPAHLAPLHDVTRMELAVEDEMLLLVVEGTSSGLWLKVRHEGAAEWNPWIQDLPHMLPLGNLISLRADVCDLALLGVLRDMVQLSELFVQLAPDPVWLDPEEDTDTDPLVLPLCTLLERSEPVVCPALRSLTIEWPRNMPKSENLGVSDIITMLAKRSSLGCPIRRLVVQAVPVHFGSIYPTHFLGQLAPLAEHVEEYEECVDPGVHVCSFEMRDMWNVEGAEKYWVVEEKQRPWYTGLRSYSYSELYQDR